MEQEIAKATAHIDDNLIDFDQSIAEAEFEAVHATKTNSRDIATPAFADSHIDKVMDFEPEVDVPQVDAKIALLLRENETLINAQDVLKGENAKLQIDLQRKNAVVRRAEAEKMQALEFKDKAIRIAAMERKKRRLTEIKARKIIMKLKQNSLQSEADSADR